MQRIEEGDVSDDLKLRFRRSMEIQWESSCLCPSGYSERGWVVTQFPVYIQIIFWDCNMSLIPFAQSRFRADGLFSAWMSGDSYLHIVDRLGFIPYITRRSSELI